VPVASVGETQVGAMCTAAPKRHAKPMKRPSKLKGVYLEEFKRTLGLPFCRLPTRVLAVGCQKTIQEIEETA
jgi:hypothetical protein